MEHFTRRPFWMTNDFYWRYPFGQPPSLPIGVVFEFKCMDAYHYEYMIHGTMTLIRGGIFIRACRGFRSTSRSRPFKLFISCVTSLHTAPHLHRHRWPFWVLWKCFWHVCEISTWRTLSIPRMVLSPCAQTALLLGICWSMVSPTELWKRTPDHILYQPDTYVYVCINICMHSYIHVCIYVYLHTCIDQFPSISKLLLSPYRTLHFNCVVVQVVHESMELWKANSSNGTVVWTSDSEKFEVLRAVVI